MKPPIKLDDLFDEWRKDAVIDETEPHKEIANISLKKCKYLEILSYHNIRTQLLQKEYLEKRRIKEQYYNGDLNNPDDLKTYGFEEPYYYTPGTKNKIAIMLDSDTELNNILLKKIANQEIVDQCKEIIKDLNSRHFSMNKYIDWKMFICDK